MRKPSTVEVVASFRLIGTGFLIPPVLVTLFYDPDDPYAVQLTFCTLSPDEEDVTWVIGRELLNRGLGEPTGIGDVRVWPCDNARGDFVAIALSSPEGNALFEAPRGLLVRFLRRTYAEVPSGRESTRLDIDTELANLPGWLS